MGLINYKGELIEEENLLFKDISRGFKYGDGLFETIRVITGSPVFFSGHYKRLIAGMNALMIDIPDYLDNLLLDQQVTISNYKLKSYPHTETDSFHDATRAYSGTYR